MNARHVNLISRYSIRYSVRGGVGLVSLLLTLVFGLGVAHILLKPAEMALTQAKKIGFENLTQEELLDDFINDRGVRRVVDWILTDKAAAESEDAAVQAQAKEDARNWSAHLLNDNPALLSAIMLILLYGWPLMVSMGAFNLFSGDIQSRGLRYHLIRADRSSIYWGRVLGMILTQSFILVAVMSVITAYMAMKLPFYGWGPLTAWGLQGLMALVVLSLPYIGLCAWISASINSPFGALTIISAALGAVPLLALLGQSQWSGLGYINYLLPWGIQHQLFHPEPAVIITTVLACLGYAAVFFYLGQRTFRSRDL